MSDDLPKHANGIRIGNVSPDNKVRCYMFNEVNIRIGWSTTWIS